MYNAAGESEGVVAMERARRRFRRAVAVRAVIVSLAMVAAGSASAAGQSSDEIAF